MSQKSMRDRRQVEATPMPAITLSGPQTSASAQTRWDLVLIWFMRLIGVLWLVDGLVQWANILGVGGLHADAFEALPDALRLTIVFFAVIDLIAAVGLWLTAAWGGVIWICAISGQFVLPYLVAGFAGGGIVVQGLYATLVALFFGLSWMAGRARDAA